MTFDDRKDREMRENFTVGDVTEADSEYDANEAFSEAGFSELINWFSERFCDKAAPSPEQIHKEQGKP